MSVKTIYTCDKCKAEQETVNQFWTVGVTATHGCSDSSREFVKNKHMQVCRPCLESLGLYVQIKPEHKASPPRIPTVEELIREIVERCT